MARPKSPRVGIIMGSSSDAPIMDGAAKMLDEFGITHEDRIVSAHRTPDRIEKYARHAEESGIKIIIAGAGGAAHLPGMVASYTVIPVIGVPILVYNYKPPAGQAGTAETQVAELPPTPEEEESLGGALASLLSMASRMPVFEDDVPYVQNIVSLASASSKKISAFEGLDSLLSITEMPTGSPVVSVGVNKAANAGIYAAKILANNSKPLRERLVRFKSDRHKAVMAESAELQEKGLARFVADRLGR